MKFFVFALAALVFLSGCCSTMPDDRCAEYGNVIDRDDCYMEEAVVNYDKATCEKVEDTYLRRLCYAVATDDETVCDEWFIDTELAACYASVAYMTQDPSVCDGLSDLAMVDYCKLEYDFYSEDI